MSPNRLSSNRSPVRGRSEESQSRRNAFVVRDGAARVGLALLGLFLVLAVIGPYVAPYDPTLVELGQQLQPPCLRHPFGTDSVGRDVFSRVLAAARIDVAMALGSVMVALCLGVLAGMVSGYVGGWVDEVLMRVMDVVQSFPAFILALSIVAVFGQSLLNIMIVIALIYVPPYARLMRTQVLSARERQYVQAARVVGNSHARILLAHVLPNTVMPVLVIATLNLGWAILTTAGLSFLGAGVEPPHSEWGEMVASGTQDLVSGFWWTSVFPGLMLFLFILACNLVGEALQRRLDPGTQ